MFVEQVNVLTHSCVTVRGVYLEERGGVVDDVSLDVNIVYSELLCCLGTCVR